VSGRGRVQLGLALALLGCRVEAPIDHGSVVAESGRGAASDREPEPEFDVVTPSETPAPPEPSLGVAERGIFSDLDPQVQIALPPGLSPERVTALIDEARALLLLYADDRPIKVYPLLASTTDPSRTLTLGGHRLVLRPGDHSELAPLLTASRTLTLAPGASPPPGDRDGDGIPDPLDLDLGAIKTTLNAAVYNQDYVRLAYPGGDVERGLGACTDVIVRALRNAGVDLQVELHEDIARAPRRYPMVTRANPDIDHRRVRTLLPWFRAHWRELADSEPLAPGDVVFMDTIASRAGPDHIGILGDRVGEGGRWLVANNWTDGTTTAFMDLLGWVPVTQRFRMPPAPEHAGPIPSLARQLVVVRGRGWDEFHGEALRFERRVVGGPWLAVGSAFPVVLGHAGLAWGRGLHGDGAPAGGRGGYAKREGDGRSPAGVFEIGPAYGRADSPTTALAYQVTTPAHRCVDDPSSRYYGQIVDGAALEPDWSSAEAMARMYALAIVIEHNRERQAAGGSCIFLHAWADPEQPVTGCTAMASAELDVLAAWLAPGAVLVSLPASSYAELRSRWQLPELPPDDGA
jgi:uncharacterized protein YijF (DUF1287 family)